MGSIYYIHCLLLRLWNINEVYTDIDMIWWITAHSRLVSRSTCRELKDWIRTDKGSKPVFGVVGGCCTLSTLSSFVFELLAMKLDSKENDSQNDIFK